MGRRIELPQLPAGQTQEQLQALYSYLYQLAEALNNNLAEIGTPDFTDEEMQTVREVVGETQTNSAMSEAETLKSLIIKTAKFVKSEIDAYNLKLVGSYEAEGKLGKYVRNTKLDVDVTPTGVTQNYTFAEIIQGLKTYEVNAKNYIKTGLLRTVSSIPVYGVAIGKDVVTFSEDGTETYNDGNKVAELTADELSFWQSGVKVASYTGNKIAFCYNGSDVFYIQNGKIYAAGDLEITAGNKLKISSGGTLDIDTNNFVLDSANKVMKTGSWEMNEYGLVYEDANEAISFGKYGVNFSVSGKPSLNLASETSTDCGWIYLSHRRSNGNFSGRVIIRTGDPAIGNTNYGASIETQIFNGTIMAYAKGCLGNSAGSWDIWADEVKYYTLTQRSSRDVKHDIKDMESRGRALDGLRPVTFIYNDDPKERVRAGLIYEEAVQVMPEICTGDGESKAINYVELIPMLVKEIQELRARVRALEELQE